MLTLSYILGVMRFMGPSLAPGRGRTFVLFGIRTHQGGLTTITWLV